jgi:hypothetical protein
MLVLDACTSMAVQSSRWACRTAARNTYGNAAIASERPYSTRTKTRRQAIQSPTQRNPEHAGGATRCRFVPILLASSPAPTRVKGISYPGRLRNAGFAISLSMPRRVTSSDSFF